MHERLRHGERVVFEDSSHMPHIEEPERFLAVVEGSWSGRACGWRAMGYGVREGHR